MFASAGKFLTQLVSLAREPIYLVGGSVRDLLISSKNIKDIDLLMPSGSEKAARAFADKIGGSFFFLDEERRISRVILQEGEDVFQFDFADFEGADLAADLGRRDFTMNAMAVDLRMLIETEDISSIIDPFGGREDIEKRIIRATAPKVLDDDPLRLLRAVRFAATLGFSIDPDTASEIKKRAEKATASAPERIRDEFFLTLSASGAGSYLMLMDSLGLLEQLLPELNPLKGFMPGKYHVHDVFKHSIMTAEHVDAVLERLGDIASLHAAAVRSHLNEELEHFVFRKAALRFACLLHDIAKAETYSRDEAGSIHFYGHDHIGADKVKTICVRFRLSKASESVIERIVRHHMRPLLLSAPAGPSKRALYRYCRDLKDALPESIVLALADAKATSEAMPADEFTDTQKTAAIILDYYYSKFLQVKDKPLVTGRDLIDLGMAPGPKFREILEDVREKQAEGALKNRKDALDYLNSLQADMA